jgi:ABC-type transport system involved in multi-copper enzyme maturation permease subunit
VTFLPIVERELRAAARRKGTYRIRSWTAVLALVASLFSLAFLWLARGGGSLGAALFTGLTSFAFGLCLLAGVFLTADCLSEEKRDGTLGLLFLTDLRGYDVVLGKFVARLVNALYGLLALLPVLAISLLLGGVTGGEFWRRALSLINALFVSLAAGIWISALARETQRAMSRALGLMLLLVAVPPVIMALSSLPRVPRPLFVLAWISPLRSFFYSSAVLYFNHAWEFWASLLLSFSLGVMFLWLASRALPQRWREDMPAVTKEPWLRRWLRCCRGTAEQRARLRRELLPKNPVAWLASLEPGFGRLAWMIVLVWAGLVVLVTIFSPRETGTMLLSWSGMRPFGFLLKALFTVQACRFFIQARRDGALEMLLSTPLTQREIIRGQTMAIRRAFLWPLAAFIGLLFLPVCVHVILGFHTLNLEQLMTGGFGLFMSAVSAVRTAADFFALFWFGLWLALTMKKPTLAPALTLLLVVILPSFLCVLDLLADLFFILWGATKLQQDLRWVLARQYQTASTAFRPFPSAPSNLPPVIPASRSMGSS